MCGIFNNPFIIGDAVKRNSSDTISHYPSSSTRLKWTVHTPDESLPIHGNHAGARIFRPLATQRMAAGEPSKEKECWVVISRSKTPPAGVLPYSDVVEEALCFGWGYQVFHPTPEQKNRCL